MMKKLIALILSVIMVFSFASCGGGGGGKNDEKAKIAELIAHAEELGKTKGTHEFKSYEHIEQIFVVLPKEGTFVDTFESAGGALEYYSNAEHVNSVEGIVVYCTSSDFSDNSFGSVSYLPVYLNDESAEENKGEAEVEDEEADEVAEVPKGKFQFVDFPMFSAIAYAAPSDSPLRSIKYNGDSLSFPDGKTGLDGLKWMLAGYSLDFDNWLAAKGEGFSEVIAAGDAVKNAAGESYYFSAEYINYLSANKEYREYETYRRWIEYIQMVVSALEAIDVSGKDEKAINIAYNAEIEKFNEANEFENDLQSIYNERAAYVKKLSTLEPTALTELEALAAEIDEIKKVGENYKDDDRYWKIKLANPNIGKYEDTLESIALLDRSIDTLYELNAETDYTLGKLLEEYSEDDMDLYVDYYNARAAYAAAVIEYEKHLETNAADIEAFNTAVDAIKANYTDESYKNDVEYMKIELRYEKLINDTANLENKIITTKADADDIISEREQLKSEYETDVAERELAIKTNNDKLKIVAYFEPYANDLKPLMRKEGAGDASEVVFEKDGFVIVDLATSIVDEVDSARKVKSSSGGGSGGRTCAEPGCTRKAATSGDTIYCTTHSRKCLECGCYIDKDAMYCMDCLRDALS